MKCLITGAAGFIGSHLSRRLLRNGHDVCGVDDFSTGTRENQLFSGIEIKNFYECDFSDRIILKQIRAGFYDVIYHLAALPRVQYSIDYPAKTTKVNIQRTVKLYESAYGNVRRVVFASSSSVYGNTDIFPTPNTQSKSPMSPYALQKSFIEDIGKMFAEFHGLDVVNLRFFNVFGPNQKPNGSYATVICAWLNAISKNQSLRLEGDGAQTRDMTYIDNVVNCCISAGLNEQKFKSDCFNVGCGKEISLNEILEYFKSKFPGISELRVAPRPGDMKRSLADISETSNALGYRIATDFWDGLERTISSWNLAV